MKIIGTYLSERQIEFLRNQSKETGISVSEIIRRVLDSYCFGEVVKNSKFDKVIKSIQVNEKNNHDNP